MSYKYAPESEQLQSCGSFVLLYKGRIQMQACVGLCKQHKGAVELLHSTCDAVRHASKPDGLTKVTFEGQTSQLCIETQSGHFEKLLH